MKKFLAWLGKRMLNGIITGVFLITTVLSVVYALNYPETPPSWEVAGGKFMNYFNSIRVACPAGQYLNGYDANFNKLCATVPAGANWAQGPQGPQGPAGVDWAQWLQGPVGPNNLLPWTICWMATQYCGWPGNIRCQGLDPRCGSCPPWYSIREWLVSFWDTNRFAFCGKD